LFVVHSSSFNLINNKESDKKEKETANPKRATKTLPNIDVCDVEIWFTAVPKNNPFATSLQKFERVSV